MAGTTLVAEHLLEQNIACIPIRMPEKAPTVAWKEFQKRLPKIGELVFNGALAMICGQVSGNIEVIDVDVKNDITGDLIRKLQSVLDDTCPDTFSKLVIQVTPSRGLHFIYKCDVIEGNQVLARSRDRKAIIETRGEGGYVGIDPTPGYEIRAGSLSAIPVITPHERAELFDACRTLNEHFEPVRQPKINSVSLGVASWDDYNVRADVPELLQTHGWKFSHSQGENQYFIRPGKTSGISGSWNGNTFYCFTSSTTLEPSKAYTPTALLTYLEFNGDFSECAKQLYSLGYGERSPGMTLHSPFNKTVSSEAFKCFKDYILREEPLDEVGIVPINGVIVLSEGNVLLITGPPKSRKTRLVCNLCKSCGLRTAYVDTEQGRKHSWRTGQSVPNADVYHLRGQDPEEIKRVINEILSCGEYKLLVIDNLRDLLLDFNDVKQAGEIELFLKRVSEVLPTIAILHENKNNQKGQGHVGYGAEKVAQTVVRVSLVDPDDPSKGSFVDCVRSRDEPFPRAFLDMAGELSGNNMIVSGGRGMAQDELFNLLGDVEYTNDELIERLAEIFGIMKSSAKNTLTQIRKARPDAILTRKEGKRSVYYTSPAIRMKRNETMK